MVQRPCCAIDGTQALSSMAFFCFTAQSLFFIKPQLAHLLTPFSVFQLQAPQRGQIGILTVVGKVVFRIVFNKRQGATDDDPRRPLALPRFVLFIEFAQQAMSVEKIKIPHLYIAVIIRAEPHTEAHLQLLSGTRNSGRGWTARSSPAQSMESSAFIVMSSTFPF
jgi:hypothetical protein